jgi:hypothetical protein
MKKLVVMVIALAICSSAYSMQRAPQKKIQAAPKAVQKAPRQHYYPAVKTLPEALRRIQQHRTILKNLKHLPSREFAQKKRHEAFLNSMDDMLKLAQDVLKSASQALPEAKLESADALEIKSLALFNQKMPQLFTDICALVAKKDKQQQSAH